MTMLLALSLLGYVTLEHADFATKLNAGFFGVLLDVRSEPEWRAGHLANAQRHVTRVCAADT